LKIDHAQKLKIKKIETETEILKIKRTNIYFFRGWENKKKENHQQQTTSLHQKYTSTSHGHGLARVKHAISF